ncbi:MAG: hypothetical protein R2713_23335 [Ilumatobacteraceae bacterium]|nr:hypothetical protein [Acidimicrobiales bacterium]MCB9393364.1 hypothetical protein [Acidimicrobiaceae bacterium]
MAGSVVPLGVNLLIWTLVAFGAGWYHRRRTIDHLAREGCVLRLRPFETGGRWYERRLRIKSWKERLPETGGRFGGMSKRQLPGRDREALERFAAECRRGERTHWTITAAGPVFVVWNTYPEAFAISVANAAGNAPFIAILRYNRARIARALARCHDEVPRGSIDGRIGGGGRR